jgi:hypothetical protein
VVASSSERVYPCRIDIEAFLDGVDGSVGQLSIDWCYRSVFEAVNNI